MPRFERSSTVTSITSCVWALGSLLVAAVLARHAADAGDAPAHDRAVRQGDLVTVAPSWARLCLVASSSTVTTRFVELVSSTSAPELRTVPTEALCSPMRRGAGHEHDPPELDRAGLVEADRRPASRSTAAAVVEVNVVVDRARVEAERGEVLLELAARRARRRRPT